MYIQWNIQFSSIIQSCPTLWDPMNCSMPDLPVHHQLPSLLKLVSIESVVPSNHLILCCALLSPSVFSSIRVFSSESVLHIRWPKEYLKAVYCRPDYLTYMQSTSCAMPGWVKHKLNQDCQGKYQYPQICG